MKLSIENSGRDRFIKYKLDYRTEAELIESIRRKREKGITLDDKEQELVERQKQEDRESDLPRFGH